MNPVTRAGWKFAAVIATTIALIVWAVAVDASKQTVFIGGVLVVLALAVVDRSTGRDLGRFR